MLTAPEMWDGLNLAWAMPERTKVLIALRDP